jgi:TatD DNase family protein
MRYDYWVDSHCHLDFADFAEEGVEAIIDRARLNRVGAMLTISTHTARIDQYKALADQFPNVWATIGVHPLNAHEDGERDITAEQLVEMAASHPKIVAIGECGLDYHYQKETAEIQAKVFREHLKAAIAANLPIIIHNRDSDKDMMAILSDFAGQGLRGVMHCFSSSKELATYALSIGFYVSFSGILTFPKAVEIHEICKNIPLKNILIETDAPYLAPIPYRGKRNEPAFVSHTGCFLSQIHAIDEQDAMHETTDNFYNLFNKINGYIHVK